MYRIDVVLTTTLLLLLISSSCVDGFGPSRPAKSKKKRCFDGPRDHEAFRLFQSWQDYEKQAQDYIEKAKLLRETLPKDTDGSNLPEKRPTLSPWIVVTNSASGEGEDYRLYVDIGREEGTWMDPRWAASGNRIAFTLDVRFTNSEFSSSEAHARMVKDNMGGSSSPVYFLNSAKYARLRSGFDRMQCFNGAYRVDSTKKQQTVRFFVDVEGISYGDVTIPRGCLYFSLPLFGSIGQLSRKEGPVTIRQSGWHTGWRREESRIVGVFKAVKLEDAQRRDRF